MKPHHVLVILLLAGAAVLTAWLRYQAMPDTTREPAEPGPVDQSMTDFTVEVTSAQGRLEYRLFGSRMRHFRADDSLIIDDPRLIQFRPNEERWEIQSPSARVSAGYETIRFHQDTLVRRQLEGGRPLRIDTRNLVVYPHQERAQSEADTLISSADSTSRSQGFRADLAEGIITQESAVRDHYVPAEQ